MIVTETATLISTAVRVLAQAVSAASQAAPSIAPLPPGITSAPGESPATVSDRLRDLRLPEDLPDGLNQWLASSLQDLGFEMGPVEVEGRRRTQKRYHYTAIKSPVGQRIVFHIPKEILSDDSNFDAVSSTAYAMGIKDQTILIMSQGLDTAHVIYTMFIPQAWKDFDIEVIFVAWQYLPQIKSMADLEEQKTLLRGVFKLDLLEGSIAGRITLEELNQIKRIASELGDFLEAASRQQLVSQAGLEQVLVDFDYQGSPLTVAGRMVDQLLAYGDLTDPNRPRCHALGALLCHICSIGGVPRQSVQFLEGILRRYALVPSNAFPKID